MKKTLVILLAVCIIAIAALCLVIPFVRSAPPEPIPETEAPAASAAETGPGPSLSAVSSDISYLESAKRLQNPERGYHVPCVVEGTPEGAEAEEAQGKLIHLEVSISEFSHNYLKHEHRKPDNYEPDGWDPLTEAFLSDLNRIMDRFRQEGSAVVIRFAYDMFEGISDMEPDMEGILFHIRQLKPFFEENQDMLLAVESGFVGQYGEQHSSRSVSPCYSETTRDTIHTLVEALLDAVPSPVSVTVRRPTYAAYACGMSLKELLSTEFDPSSPYYRVGVYNDGMFGSEDDLDTFQNREAEIAWLNVQAVHTPYGGETNYDQSTDGFHYTDGNYVCKEMFRTHVTYLNDEWPEETIDEWKRTAYNGEDPVYAGISTYTFFENHMGYRYVLRDFQAAEGSLSFTIENVGAGSMIREKYTSLVLEAENGGIWEIPTAIDVRTWASRTQTCETVPVQPQPGTYRVYLKIADRNGNQVQLANDNPFTENGNLIGTIAISAG